MCRQTNTHEESGERLGEVLQVRGLETPPVAKRARMPVQVLNRKTEDLPEVHN